MSRRKGFKPNYRRDKYGRYRGKGALKPWKNNNPGYYKKGQKIASRQKASYKAPARRAAFGSKKSNTKRNVILAVGATAAIGGAAYGVHKYRQNRAGVVNPAAAPVRRGRVVPARRQVGRAAPRLRPRPHIAGGVKTGAAKAVVSSAAPRIVDTSPRPGNAAGVVNPSPASFAKPEVAKTPPKIKASSLIAGAGAVAKAAAVSVGSGRNEEDDAAQAARDRWKNIELARLAGVPAAATYIDSGGSTAGLKKAAKKLRKVKKDKPVASPEPVRTPEQSKAAVDKIKTVSFNSPGNIVSIGKPSDYGMVNEKGNRIRVFPKSPLRKSGPPGQVTPKAKATTATPTVAPKVAEAKKLPAPKAPIRKTVTTPKPGVTAGTRLRPVAKPTEKSLKPLPAPTPSGKGAKTKYNESGYDEADGLSPEEEAKLHAALRAKTPVTRKSAFGSGTRLVKKEAVIGKKVPNTGIAASKPAIVPSAPAKGPIPTDKYHAALAKFAKANNEEGLVNWLHQNEVSGRQLNREQRQILHGGPLPEKIKMTEKGAFVKGQKTVYTSKGGVT